jgi:ribonuclease P protein subunit POP4
MITPKNLIRHELIGLDVEIEKSSNKFHVGLKGLVVDETKNLITIKTSKGLKKIQKMKTDFVFNLGDKRVRVDGSKIIARPEDRIKLKVKKW